MYGKAVESPVPITLEVPTTSSALSYMNRLPFSISLHYSLTNIVHVPPVSYIGPNNLPKLDCFLNLFQESFKYNQLNPSIKLKSTPANVQKDADFVSGIIKYAIIIPDRTPNKVYFHLAAEKNFLNQLIIPVIAALSS